jgi:hypothetical protein
VAETNSYLLSRLAAYLYEITPNDQLKTVAELSLDFMLSYLWNGTIVIGQFDPRTCTFSNDTVDTVSSAYLIEGLSVWANVTKNDTLTSL